jgi:hypothetical protein
MARSCHDSTVLRHESAVYLPTSGCIFVVRATPLLRIFSLLGIFEVASRAVVAKRAELVAHYVTVLTIA